MGVPDHIKKYLMAKEGDEVDLLLYNEMVTNNEALRTLTEEVKKKSSSEIEVEVTPALLERIKGEPGQSGTPGQFTAGKDGQRGSKFLGAFNTVNELPDPEDLLEGDFALVASTGELWYV